MKNIFCILLLFLLSLVVTDSAYAQTETITPTPTKAASNNILNDLKDKIASRVAQLNLVQKKGVIGTIDTVSGTQITVTDIHDNAAIIDVDELTKFSSPSAKSSFGFSDLTKGTTIDVLGLYNKQSKHVLARFVSVITRNYYIFGQIASIDADNFIVNVISPDNKLTPVDIETITKINTYTDVLEKSSFSKLEVGKQIVVVGYHNMNNPRQILALRVTIFPNVASNPRIILPQQALSPDTTIVPSTGSGKKLTPITR